VGRGLVELAPDARDRAVERGAVIGPVGTADVDASPGGVQPDLDRGATVVVEEDHLRVVRAAGEFGQAPDQLSRAAAEIVGRLAVADRDGGAHALILPAR
jgi:hypothetical protein